MIYLITEYASGGEIFGMYTSEVNTSKSIPVAMCLAI